MKQLTRIASVGALAAALAATACNRNPDATGTEAQAQFALPTLPATLPLEAGDATALAPAPAVSDLPAAAPLRLARVADPQQAYGYADAAFSYDEALGDAPPDYGFDYEGADPWAWQGSDDSVMVAEPIDDGYRYYYYRPGASDPYFVRDPYYSYGYAGGLLAVVYGADGGIVPYADYGPRLTYAAQYYARGGQLWTASRRGHRRPVIAANWLRQRPVILAARDRWSAGRAHQPAWQRYYEANRPRQAHYWQAEQVRREADARRFAGWRDAGFRTAPPPRAIPPAWQKASWARDDRRYRPAADALRNEPRDTATARQERREERRDEQRRDQLGQPQQPADRQEAQQARQQRRAEQRGAEQDRRQAERRQSEQRAERQRAQPAQQARQAEQAQRQAQRAERQQAQRQAERATRERAGHAERRPAEQAERREAQPSRSAERQGADQAQRHQARQAEQAQRQADRAGRQQAERAQRQQAERVERQQADRGQRQQAERAQRQAEQGQRQQAEQAQRQQAQQAQRQQTQPAQQQPAQQARRAERQQQRQERRAAKQDGSGPN